MTTNNTVRDALSKSTCRSGAREMVEITPEHILQLGMGFWASKTLLSAVELGVFTRLAEAPADLAALTKRLGLHQRSARDFLDALVALKVLERENGIYRNSAESNLFLDRAKPTYIGGVLEMANTRLYGHWGKLQNEAKHGGDPFRALYATPERLRGFLAAMSGISMGAAQAIAAKFPWGDRRTFADIGAAQGMVPVTLAQIHSHLSGIGFDLPPVQPVFEEFVAKHGLPDRVRFQAGSFFEDPLPAADVIIMGHILHDWDLTTKKMLLSKAFAALPMGGAIIVYDVIIDEDRRENAFGLLMSLNMLIETSGGFDYTAADCQSWMREVGFSETRVEHLVGPDSLVIGLK
jgi:hypothetical protein